MTTKRLLAFFACLMVAGPSLLATHTYLASASQPAKPVLCCFGPPYFSPDGRYVALRYAQLKKELTRFGSNWQPMRLKIVDARTWMDLPRPAGQTSNVRDDDGDWSADGRYFVLKPIQAIGLQWAWDLRKGEWARFADVKLSQKSGGGGDWSDPLHPPVMAEWNPAENKWAYHETQWRPDVRMEANHVSPITRLTPSPDGQYWACVVNGNTAGPGRCLQIQSHLVLIQPHKEGMRILGDSQALAPVAWSKSGDHLLYDTGKGSGDFTIFTVSNGRSKTVGNDGWIHRPCFHPTTGAVWAIRRGKAWEADQLVERVDGKWTSRYFLSE